MKRRWTGTGVMAVVVVMVSGCHSMSAVSNHARYTATLTGSQQAPPVDTPAHGKALFTVSPDGQSISYEIMVNGIHNVTTAHLHLGSAGENGEYVAWLYPSSPPPQEIAGSYTGLLAQGKITKDDFVGQLKGKAMSVLLTELRHGNVYVNVHTKQQPKGEIRGQVRP